jgi:plasmid maintenance system antidote protein VapI
MSKKQVKLSDQMRAFLAEAAEQTSLRQVARDTGVDVATLSRILSGERAVSAAVWDTLGEHFGLELVRKDRSTKGR